LPHLSHPPKTHVISTEGGAFAAAVERPLYFALALALAVALAFALRYLFSPNLQQTHVISTEGGAFAAAAERPLYFALALALAFALAFALRYLFSPNLQQTPRHLDRRRRFCRRSGETPVFRPCPCCPSFTQAETNQRSTPPA
jgi:hypothetical protein